MAGRTVLVTGARGGVGAETARVLVGRGATVHVTGAPALATIGVPDGAAPLIALDRPR
jgi:NAD(P)-dependent dehydrogenase (short-subunit alcohol dehydrogenase family)